MRLCVFGASGRTGSSLVRLARERGHEVTVFFRTDSRASPPQGAAVVRGDLADRADVERAVNGADAVICLYGTKPQRAHAFCVEILRTLIDAVRALTVRRLIYVSSRTAGGVSSRRLLVRLLNGLSVMQHLRAARDRAQQVKLIEASPLDWTIIASPRIADKRHSRMYRAGPDLRINPFSRITRDALAAAVLDQAASTRFLRQRIVVKNLG